MVFDETPLIVAVKNVHENIVNLLLAHEGIDINCIDVYE